MSVSNGSGDSEGPFCGSHLSIVVDPSHGTGGPQSLYPDQFDRLMGELRIIAPVLGRTLPLARG